jgi:hypothetical protein
MVWFQLGLEHIADIHGYDHLLFVLAMMAPYSMNNWKQIAWLITAFTLGHSLTLALVSLSGPLLSSQVVEMGIAITILATALYNSSSKVTGVAVPIRDALVGVFGLIHGMGFSNYFTSLLGTEHSIWLPLLSFNVGVEVGQIGFAVCVLLVQWVVIQVLRVSQRSWQLFVSGGAAFVALTLILDRL